MNKNIILIVLIVIVLTAGYFGYSKVVVPQVEAKKVAEEQKQVVITAQKKEEEKIENYTSQITEKLKDEAYIVAEWIFDDCKGWNSHNMEYYAQLYQYSDAFLYYFVNDVYPKVDTGMNFIQRLNKQNWGAVKTSASTYWGSKFVSAMLKNNKWNDAAAKRMIEMLKTRISAL